MTPSSPPVLPSFAANLTGSSGSTNPTINVVQQFLAQWQPEWREDLDETMSSARSSTASTAPYQQDEPAWDDESVLDGSAASTALSRSSVESSGTLAPNSTATSSDRGRQGSSLGSGNSPLPIQLDPDSLATLTLSPPNAPGGLQVPSGVRPGGASRSSSPGGVPLSRPWGSVRQSHTSTVDGLIGDYEDDEFTDTEETTRSRHIRSQRRPSGASAATRFIVPSISPSDGVGEDPDPQAFELEALRAQVAQLQMALRLKHQPDAQGLAASSAPATPPAGRCDPALNVPASRAPSQSSPAPAVHPTLRANLAAAGSAHGDGSGRLPSRPTSPLSMPSSSHSGSRSTDERLYSVPTTMETTLTSGSTFTVPGVKNRPPRDPRRYPANSYQVPDSVLQPHAGPPSIPRTVSPGSGAPNSLYFARSQSAVMPGVLGDNERPLSPEIAFLRSASLPSGNSPPHPSDAGISPSLGSQSQFGVRMYPASAGLDISTPHYSGPVPPPPATSLPEDSRMSVFSSVAPDDGTRRAVDTEAGSSSSQDDERYRQLADKIAMLESLLTSQVRQPIGALFSPPTSASPLPSSISSGARSPQERQMQSHIQALQVHLEQLTNLQSQPSSYPASPPYRDGTAGLPSRPYSGTSAGSSGHAAPHVAGTNGGTVQIRPMPNQIDTSHEPSTVMRERAWQQGNDPGSVSSSGMYSPLGHISRPAGRGAQRQMTDDVPLEARGSGGGHGHYPHSLSESSDSSQTLPQHMLSPLSPPRKSFTAKLGRKTRFAEQPSVVEPALPPQKEGKKLTRLLRSTVTARRTDDDGPHVIYPTTEGKFKQGPGRGRMYIKDSSAGRPPYPT